MSGAHAALLAGLIMAGVCPHAARAAYVVVDTGHMRAHPGAVSPGGKVEYDYNLQVSDALAAALAADGQRVARMAADGKDIALKERTAAHPDADFFVSIHHDSIQQEWIDAGRRREFRGYSLFVSEKNPDYAKSLACARAIGTQLLTIGEVPSLYHQTPIPGENRPLIDARLGIHRFDDLVVLKTAAMPAVLVEVGVIANPDEEHRLGEPAVVRRQADAIARGIRACMQGK
ncbi:N-acetylmuramoyl-L-alanine amidase [Bordetella genomosp. 13]|uniref:N-acetylmuramoyl-L-alanine amidase family protein n=1 Tax=Bordetella genomosp. 13 TaxID=463040 RepID=UPI00391F29E7